MKRLISTSLVLSLLVGQIAQASQPVSFAHVETPELELIEALVARSGAKGDRTHDVERIVDRYLTTATADAGERQSNLAEALRTVGVSPAQLQAGIEQAKSVRIADDAQARRTQLIELGQSIRSPQGARLGALAIVGIAVGAAGLLYLMVAFVGIAGS